MLATPDGLPGLGLVDVEPVDPARSEEPRDLGMETLRERLGASGAARLDDPVGDLVSGEDRVPGRPVGQGVATTRATASAYRRRGWAPWIVSIGSPPTKTITVGSDSTP